MAQRQITDSAADAYAAALIELAEERGQLQDVANDVDALKQAMDDDPAVARFLRDPGIGAEDRRKVLDAALDGASPTLVSVLHVMNNKGRLGKLPAMLAAFEKRMDEKLGKVEVDVTVASGLDDAQLDEVRQRVGRALGKDAVVHQYVDESILGGMVLRVGDKVIDTSVKNQLDQLRDRLLAAK